MNAVIYARYSSDRQTEQSIDGQLRECYAFAESEGIQIIGEYIDRAISGTTDRRPDFQRMIEDSGSHQFQAVIVYRLDRFARNRYDSAIYKSKLKKNGVKVLSAKEHITDTPEGIIMEALLEGMNEYYSAELSQKIKRGMRENIYKGKTTGGYTALGYKVGADKRLEIDERGAAIVRMIFAEYDNGKTFAEICAMLNDAGYVTQRGKQFRHDTLSRICSNRKYIGEYASDMVAEPSACPAIIDRDLWERVQTKLKNSKRKHRHSNPKHDYLLTGFLTCAQCGKPIRGTAGTSKTGKRYYYYKCDAGCCGRMPAYQLEDTIVHALEDALTPEKCDAIADKAYALYQKERAENVQLQAAKAERKEVEKKLQNALDAVLSGIHSQGLNDAIAELERRKTALEAEIRQLSIQVPDLKREHFQIFMHKFAKLDKSQADKSDLIEALVNRTIIYPEKIAILINVTDKTNTPPLEQITATLGTCSHCCESGGAEEN